MLRHTTPGVRLRRSGANQQPIQPNPTNIKQLSGILGRCLAKMGRGKCYKNNSASDLYTTRHWTDDTTRNELLPNIPTPPLQLRPTGYGHPSTASCTPLTAGNRHKVTNSTPRLGSQGAKKPPHLPLPNAIIYQGKQHTGEVYWLGSLASSRVPAWRPPC